MQATDSKAGLYAKMAAVMAEMSNIPKTGTNDHFKYKFVTADAVADKVRELLGEKGIAFFASIVGRELMEVRKGSEKTDPKTGEVTRLMTTSARWVVNFEFTFADGDSGATQSSTWTAEADSADDKGINKCATAAEKYFLLKTFIVSSADEPDADAGGKRKRHWVIDGGGGKRFNARMKELQLAPSDVLAQLEPDRVLERLSDTTLTQAEAFARLDELAAAKPSGDVEAPQPPPPPNAPSTPVSGVNSGGVAPNGTGSPGSTGAGSNGGSDEPLFPLEVAGAEVVTLDNGRKVHTTSAPVPGRTVEGMPSLGTLDMKALLKRAWDEKLVSGQNHFANLIDLLKREGAIRDASSADAVLEAIRQHEAEKDLQKEGVQA